MPALPPAPDPTASEAEHQPRTGPQHDVRAGSSPAPGVSHGGRRPRTAPRPPPAGPGSLGRAGAAAKLVQKFRGGGALGRRGGGGPPSCHCRLPPGQAEASSRPARRGARGDRGPSAGTCPPRSAQRGAGCCLRPAAAAPSHPAPSHPGKRRAATSQTPRGAGAEPACPAAVRPRPPALPDPSRGAGVAHAPSPRAALAGHGGDGGAAGSPRPAAAAARQGLALPPPEQMRWRREEPPRPQAAPSPAAHPGAAAPLRSAPRRAAPLRAAPCGGARGALRAAPGAFPGQPRIFRNLPPGAARRGRDRQRGRRNHVGLRDGYNTFYLEKHYITLRDVTWDS